MNTLPGPDDIHRHVLPNGIVVLTRSNFNSSSVVISGYVNAGSQLDPADKLGLAHFTALGLMRGTRNTAFQQIFNRLESIGASLGFGASVHNTSFGGRALAEDLPTLISTLSEVLRFPVFPPEQMEKLKGQLLTGLAIRGQNTADMAALEFDKLLFLGHPYGRPEDGYPETISPITPGDICEFHSHNYGPENMVIVVTGAVEAQGVFDLVVSQLGDWQPIQKKNTEAHPEVSFPHAEIRSKVAIPGKSQSDLVVGTLGPRRLSGDYLACSLGNSILGQFGLMGRIGDSVREKAGLAYYAYTSLNAWIESGSWEVSAGVNLENVNRATSLILEELKKFTSEPVSTEELEENQSNFIGRLPLSLESNSGVANAILNLERFQLGLDYYRRYKGLIRSVTPGQILEAARKYIDPGKMVIVSAGSEHRRKTAS